MRPVAFQIVDRAAFRSAVEVLRLAHKTAVAVCLDGQQYRFDPTADAYRPSLDSIIETIEQLYGEARAGRSTVR